MFTLLQQTPEAEWNSGDAQSEDVKWNGDNEPSSAVNPDNRLSLEKHDGVIVAKVILKCWCSREVNLTMQNGCDCNERRRQTD